MRTHSISYLKFILLLMPALLVAQHSINGTFSPASDYTYAFLYKATPAGPEYMDRSELTEEGHFEIVLDSSAAPGIYKIVYATPPEEFNFDFMYNGKEDITIHFDAEKGLEFVASEDNKLWASYTNSINMINRTISNFYTQESSDKKAFMDIFKTLEDTQNAYEEASKGKLSHTFITANRPYITKSFEDLSTYSNHLKDNFLTHVDFSNPLLQSSDFLLDRSLAYVFAMPGNNTNADYIKAIDHLVSKMANTNATLKSNILVMVWQNFAEKENKEISDYLIDTYLLKLASETNNGALADQLNGYRNTSIGVTAPDFNFGEQAVGNGTAKSLHDLSMAERYLVIFWSSTCSHCLDELPQVEQLLKDKTDVKVIAFALEDDDKNWKKEIAKYPDFIHVLGLQKWENLVATTYGISGTPSYFLLDADKKITAKPFDFKVLKEILE